MLTVAKTSRASVNANWAPRHSRFPLLNGDQAYGLVETKSEPVAN